MKRCLSILPFLALGACAPVPASDGGARLVDDGKADNFYSSVASEFTVAGSLPVQMTADEYADVAKRAELAKRRITAFGLYLTAYITDKEPEIFTNTSYGSFHGMVRNRAVDDLSFTGSPDTGVSVSFTMDLAGPKDMLEQIAVAQMTQPSGGKTPFDVKMPKGQSFDPDAVPWRTIRSFDPATCNCETETVHLEGRMLPASQDAYPEYRSMFSDGVLDITLFQGHDYNTQRSDLREAREYFSWLQEQGFKAPVDSFEQLAPGSGPFTRTIKAGGKEVRVDVRMFHSDMFTMDRRGQHDLALSELVARDVFFYNGHAGPYYGFYLDEAKAAQVEPTEIQNAPFTDKKQIFIANGCQTYSQYADNLYDNQRKSEDNLDVITTVNFSYGEGTTEFLGKLLELDEQGQHKPASFYDLVNAYNETWRSSEEVFYGAMGIDGNPLLHPYANTAQIGKACTADGDCGDAYGNRCVAKGETEHVCGAVALGEMGCPAGTKYRSIAEGDTIVAHVCIK
jgi:hypothetical protein